MQPPGRLPASPAHILREREPGSAGCHAVLASTDRPFVIERPDELRGLVVALAERLAASARGG